MIRVSQIRVSLNYDNAELEKATCRVLGLPPGSTRNLKTVQRAIDARKSAAVFLSCTVDVALDDEPAVLAANRDNPKVHPAPADTYQPPGNHAPDPSRPRPIIVGTGPCGLISGLILARAGLNPIILERGKEAGPRARDVTGFWRRGLELDPDSNVQFGEGGAGTFSDGKLYTQIKDREGRLPWLLRELVAAGAPKDILVKARPHIGTDKLITVVRHIRREILSLGGDIRFQTKVVALDLASGNSKVQGVVLADGSTVSSDRVILALGHSARDTFAALHAQGVPFIPKPFSIGVRIEHPQSMIDRRQYGRAAGHKRLGAAPYKFVHHTRSGRSAYSFCMCPGGLVVAAASEPGGVTTNGMSSYTRAESNANAGFMVDVWAEDFLPVGDRDPLAGFAYQRLWEQKAFELGGGGFKAPVQLLGDFLAGRASTGPGSFAPSYQPGVTWSNLRGCLPDFVAESIAEAAIAVDRRSLRGFAMEDAILTGVETRSSCPARIPRDRDSLQCEGIAGLYPAGEGAGYAGGIISAAVDGIKVAEKILVGT